MNGLVLVISTLTLLMVVRIALDTTGPLPRLSDRSPNMQAHGLLGKAYAPTFKLIFVGLVVIGIAIWVL